MTGAPGDGAHDAGDEGLRAALAHAPLAVFATDPAGVCTVAEGLVFDQLGLGQGMALGRPLADVLLPDAGLHHHANQALGGHVVSTTIEGGGRAYDVFLRPLPEGGLAGVAVEVTLRVRTEERLAHQASFDALTGLPNRHLLLDRLRMAQARGSRDRRHAALLFVGVDRLARVNQSLGQAAGDRLLAELARALAAGVRPADTVARFAGDKFIVLCEAVDDEAQALTIAARLQAALAEPMPLAGRHLVLTASVGVTMVDPGVDPEVVLGDAEAALFRAKAQGGARTVVFDPSMRARALARLDTEQALRMALQNGELTVHYQPIVDLTSGAISGLEALLRWNHAERGRLAPAEFIPLAEETGLIIPIGQWVLGDAAHQLRQWLDDDTVGDDMVMSVNLSAVQLSQPDLPTVIDDVLRQHSLPPGRVCFELTESWLMEDADAALAVLHALKELGVSLAIDDFGIGHSSLGYLHRLPIDALKVDRAFVVGLDADPPDEAIACAVVDLAHTFGLHAVGEGVETAGHLAALRRLGCDRAQGFYFARPHPAEEMALLLGSNPRW